ncbi:MAG: Methyltransferase type 11 [Candidatus Kaiserbacteria bacterium]|nr:Methyltransferase type 11 [Candidatus Kaiserbacteria bacterium]
MGSADFNQTRKAIAEQAKGTVLEIGFGSGYNIPFYNNVRKLFALEPSGELYAYAKNRIKSASFPVEYVSASAEEIPLPTASVDTVVSTWTLCSIPDLKRSLREVIRVLKPEGEFVFVEHGRSPKRLNSLAQSILTPISKHFTGNCHLDRQIDTYIREAGFDIQELIAMPEAGRPLMFSYRGVARKRVADIHKAMGVLIRDRKLLVTRSKDKIHFIGPGGKLEAGETAQEALIRELHEELQITVKTEDLEVFGSFSAAAAGNKSRIVTAQVFTVARWEGEIIPGNEIEEIRWIASEDAKSMTLGSIFADDVIPRLKEHDLID